MIVPKFTVIVVRDATARFPITVEAESLEEVRSHFGKYDYEGPILSTGEPRFTEFDQVETYRVENESGQEIYDSNLDGGF